MVREGGTEAYPTALTTGSLATGDDVDFPAEIADAQRAKPARRPAGRPRPARIPVPPEGEAPGGTGPSVRPDPGRGPGWW